METTEYQSHRCARPPQKLTKRNWTSRNVSNSVFRFTSLRFLKWDLLPWSFNIDVPESSENEELENVKYNFNF